MSHSHYYSNQPDSEHHYEEWSFELKGKNFRFTTDNGVFSKKTVDFGSRLLIETLDLALAPEGPVLDVGCGYGPMGLSLAASAPARLVEMVDVNKRALALAQRNATANGIANVLIHSSNIYAAIERHDFAAIVSNPPIRAGKEVVHTILAGAFPLLKKGGSLTIVIQKKQGAPSAQKKMLETFGNATVLKKDKGYFIIQSFKEED